MSTPPPLTPRRPDLDALRAFAMLVGIGLHAALSFTPFPWPVQDSRQNEWFGILFAAVHGFRMPLFFLLSGFFTTMLWRKRGLKALLGHRFQRILVPCMIGLVTIVPAVNWISGIAIESGLKKSEAAAATQSADSDIWSAVRHTDLDAIDRHLQQGADINAKDPAFGITPLSWAALHGETVILEALLERGATIDASNRDGGTPLHAAAFLGHADIVALLIRRGASLAAQNHRGDASLDAATVDWETTRFLIALLKIEIDEGQVNRGRIAVIQQLHDAGDVSPATTPSPPGRQDKKHGSRSLVQSLIYTPVFHHLWFLWFLCWLVPGFAVCAWIARFFEWRRPPHWLILTPARFLWLIPLTMIPQWFMGTVSPSFGPDTSAGLLPMPHVLLYYAIFFGFGALYFDCDDSTGRPGRKWILMLLLALLLIFPLGLGLVFGAFGLREKGIDPTLVRLASAALQVTYAWMMTFACMGLFRRVIHAENKTIRYLSDSAYWLYLAHVPLVLAAQLLVRDWPLSASFKFLLLCAGVSGILLLSYQAFVRYTPLGILLNGPRVRSPRPPPLPRN